MSALITYQPWTLCLVSLQRLRLGHKWQNNMKQHLASVTEGKLACSLKRNSFFPHKTCRREKVVFESRVCKASCQVATSSTNHRVEWPISYLRGKDQGRKSPSRMFKMNESTVLSSQSCSHLDFGHWTLRGHKEKLQWSNKPETIKEGVQR